MVIPSTLESSIALPASSYRLADGDGGGMSSTLRRTGPPGQPQPADKRMTIEVTATLPAKDVNLYATFMYN